MSARYYRTYDLAKDKSLENFIIQAKDLPRIIEADTVDIGVVRAIPMSEGRYSFHKTYIDRTGDIFKTHNLFYSDYPLLTILLVARKLFKFAWVDQNQSLVNNYAITMYVMAKEKTELNLYCNTQEYKGLLLFV
jgi:hypothetical protein